MQVAFNLTPVLVALIICIFLYAMCKMARQDEAKKKQEKEEEKKVIKMPYLPDEKRSSQERHLVEYIEDKVKKGEPKN